MDIAREELTKKPEEISAEKLQVVLYFVFSVCLCYDKSRFFVNSDYEKAVSPFVLLNLSLFILHGSLCLTLLCGVLQLLQIQAMRN
jgi:hypothetical protein